jgi:hypothetical protein
MRHKAQPLAGTDGRQRQQAAVEQQSGIGFETPQVALFRTEMPWDDAPALCMGDQRMVGQILDPPGL